MTEDIKPDVIKLTQTTLGSFIKKPALSEKHLKKPPFRFLHDIVTSVIRETGFLSGLYPVLELQSENIKDRDMKIAFLQKLIDCITIVTEKTITARPSKIVAGLEPTRTNELLQAIGYALKKKLDSSNAVAQIQGGEAPNKKKSKTKDEKKPDSKVKQSPTTKNTTNKASDKITKVSKTTKIKESPKTKNDKSKETGKKEKISSRKADGTENKTKVTKGESPRDAMKEKKIKESPRDIKKKVKESPTEKKDKEPSVVSKIVPNEQKTLEVESPPPELNKIDTVSNNAVPEENILEPSTSPQVKLDTIEMRTNTPPKETVLVEEKTIVDKSMSEEPEMPRIIVKKDAVQDDVIMMPKEPVKMENLVRPKTSLRPPSVRPSSARPAAPRLKDRNEIILPPDELVSMGKVNVIVENFSVHEEEDNEETVVVEEPPELTFQPPPTATITDIPAEKGLLVGQILEQLGDSVPDGGELKPRVEIEWEAGGKKNREVARKEMKRLCDSIQTLTRAANPLGKLMNFLQEDMDSMRSELKMWLEVNEKLAVEIKTQRRLNEESIQPLKKQLNRMDDDIAKQREQISITHANILRNEQKVKMLITRKE